MPIDKITQLISNPDITQEQFVRAINSMDHFDLARLLHQLPAPEKIRIFESIEDSKKLQELLYETDEISREEIMGSLPHDFLAHFLSGMAEDEATDILKELPPETRDELLEQMGPQDADMLKDLIRHGEETAGSLMIPRFNKVTGNQRAADILIDLKKNNYQGNHPYFYVVNNHDELLGYFKLRDLLNVRANAKAYQFMSKSPPKVTLDDHCEKVASLMDHEQISTVPVVDEKNVVQGIITFDDVLRTMKEIASEEIFTMVGTKEADPFAKRIHHKILARAPWLFSTFIGGLVSASILNHYVGTLKEFSSVIFFIPFVLGLAGNVGIQGATVIVRGLATGDIQSDNLRTVVISEIWVGVLNGLIFGILCGVLITAVAGSFLNASPLIGLTVGLGILLAVSMASLIGSTTPIIFLRLNIDPAISTGPCVTIMNDIAGLTIYLGVTTLIYSFF
ncbi:MAG: magnesium transporter [Nitrospinales bacterium]